MRLLQLLSLILFAIIGANSVSLPDSSPNSPVLYRRKGGGGKGGGSSGGKGGGSSSGGKVVMLFRKPSNAHRAKTVGKSGGGSSGAHSSSSSSSSPRTYAGGRYYGGGSSAAYAAGSRSPGGLLPLGLLSIAAVGGIFAGAWLWPVFFYPYNTPYNFYNQSAGMNQTKNVLCLCQEYTACGCDENSDSSYITSIVGNGSEANLNSTLVKVANVNGTDTIVINGTLPNGTDTGSAASGMVGGRISWMAGWLAIAAVTFCVL
jgi:hypothetical protein